MCAAGALCATGTALCGKVKIDKSSLYTIQANMYLWIIGAPGNVKSPPMCLAKGLSKKVCILFY